MSSRTADLYRERKGGYWHFCAGAWVKGERLGCELEHSVKLEQRGKPGYPWVGGDR